MPTPPSRDPPSLSCLCPSRSPSCLRGTQVAPGPPSACQTSLRAASPARSPSCQTAWTPPDLKVPAGQSGGTVSSFFCLLHRRSERRRRRRLLTSCSLHRTSEHGRSDEDEPPSRDGRHGPTGRCRFHSLPLQRELWASGALTVS